MITWTDEMIAVLRDLRAKGVPIFSCAERIGVAYATCVYKCRELGIADRRNHGRVPGMIKADGPFAALINRLTPFKPAAVPICDTSAAAITAAATFHRQAGRAYDMDGNPVLFEEGVTYNIAFQDDGSWLAEKTVDGKRRVPGLMTLRTDSSNPRIPRLR